jgi:hypothetical protein
MVIRLVRRRGLVVASLAWRLLLRTNQGEQAKHYSRSNFRRPTLTSSTTAPYRSGVCIILTIFSRRARHYLGNHISTGRLGSMGEECPNA